MQQHKGSCHCGAVKLRRDAEVLDMQMIASCDSFNHRGKSDFFIEQVKPMLALSLIHI